MQSKYESNTSQLIRQAEYNQDQVRGSGDIDLFNRKIDNLNAYTKSGGYESRYPATYSNNVQRDGDLPYSPNLSPSKYSNVNNSSSNARMAQYTQAQLNNNIKRHQQKSHTNYMSPSRSTVFVPSPYDNNDMGLPENCYIKAGNNNYNIAGNNNYKIAGNNSQFPSASQQQQSRNVIEMQKMVSQLKLSLQQSMYSQNALHEQLQKQKTRSFELSEIKRKLEQQLSKMEFQLERLTSNDILGQRQLHVKYQAQSMQSQRLNGQVADLMEQLKRVKKQCRQIMTQNNKAKGQCDMLRNENIQLLDKMESLVEQVQSLKRQFYRSEANYKFLQQQDQRRRQHSSSSQQARFKSPSNINNIATTRTINNESGHVSQHIMNRPLNIGPQSPEARKPIPGVLKGAHRGIDYDIENSKLIEDYNKLSVQNQSMKKLYRQFYRQSPQKNHWEVQLSHESYNRSISQQSQQLEATHPSLYSPLQNSGLRTFQKRELYTQISFLRQQVVHQLLHKHFAQSLQDAQTKKQNVLVIFIKLLTKDLKTIQKMVLNYLQARDLLKKQLNVKRLAEGEQGTPTTKTQIAVEQMLQKVKQKLKIQLKSHRNSPNSVSNQSEVITMNINAYFLALFRLLTLINKHQNNDIQQNSNTLSKLKHSVLKYVHKIYQETYSLAQDVDNQRTDNHHTQNYSLQR